VVCLTSDCLTSDCLTSDCLTSDCLSPACSSNNTSDISSFLPASSETLYWFSFRLLLICSLLILTRVAPNLSSLLSVESLKELTTDIISLYPSSWLTSSTVSLTIAATAALIAAISSLSSSSATFLAMPLLSAAISSISSLSFPSTICLIEEISLVIYILSISNSSSISSMVKPS